jgi:hypothetical protein
MPSDCNTRKTHYTEDKDTMSTELVTSTGTDLTGFFPGGAVNTGIDADEMFGLTPDILRITIPAGGALSFEVPGDDPERPDSLSALDGIIVHHHAAAVLWLTSMDSKDDGESVPHAYSDDGITQVVSPEAIALCKKNGWPEPLADFANCPYNQWGSATIIDPKANPKGKAVKNLRRLYILREGQVAPDLLTLPPTSIKPWSNYVVRAGGAANVVTRITLKRQERGSIKWSIAQFQNLGVLPEELRAQARELASAIKGSSSRTPKLDGDDYQTKPASSGATDALASEFDAKEVPF